MDRGNQHMLKLELTLADKLLLLVWDKAFSTVPLLVRPSLGPALKIAMIEDLKLRGKLSLEPGRLVISDDKPIGDPFLDDMLRTLKSGKSPFTPQDIIWKLFDHLADKEIFRRKRALLENQYLLVNPAVRQAIVDQIRAFVSSKDADDKESQLLLSLLITRNPLLAFIPPIIPLPEVRNAMGKKIALVTKGEVELALAGIKKAKDEDRRRRHK
jgi:hypothetical protein